MPKKSSKSLLALAAAGALLSAPATASAQTASNATMTAVYEDIRDIAERLLQREVSRSLTVNLAVRAPPGFLIYFPETLQAAFDGRFQAVAKTARAEAADFVASYVLANLPTRNAADPKPTNLLTFLGGTAGHPAAQWWVTNWQDEVKPTKPKCSADAKGCADAIVALMGPAHFRKTNKYVASWPGSPTAKADSAAKVDTFKLIDECAAGYAKPHATPLACELALTTREAVMGNSAGVELHAIRAVAFAIEGDDEKNRKDALDLAAAIHFRLQHALPVDMPKTIPVKDAVLVDTVANLLRAARTQSANQLEMKDILTALDTVLEITQGRTCPADEKATIDTLTTSRDNAKAPADKAAKELDGARQKAIAAKAAASKNPTKALRATADAADKAVKAAEHAYAGAQKQLDETQLALNRWPTCKVVTVSRSAIQGALASADMPALVAAIHARDAKAITLRVIEVSLAGAAQVVGENCGDQAKAATDGEAKPSFNEASEATRAFEERKREGKANAKDKEDKDAKCKVAQNAITYVRVMTILAEYAFEAEKGVPSATTRGAFRDAVVEFLSVDGEGSGLERRRGPNGHRPTGDSILYPVPGLRFSFSTGYFNSVTGNSYRILPTVSWPNFRFGLTNLNSTSYVGLQISVLDFADPFAEFALRSTKSFANGELVWANVVRPRLDLLVGWPQLSRHLALSIGVSARPVAAFEDSSSKGNYIYHPIFNCPGADCKGKGIGFAEMSLGIQYVP
jgi:hypothetical protein